ncbi:hydroxymethylpyrimidine/phosphomethylpyrimidine kinase [Methylomonas sp. HYX-M1]|uniref:bifunctional hydroxymethylpyrimidine kinase/phosphomethylpyrimidine kinase n=1 Tax=Methylomonas sp. HYX-M1 TaxID=3139307 RepID=UPI00345C5070
MSERPVVLCFSGHDPCGGAGVQADIEAIVSHRCHAVSVITALTEQDTGNVKRLFPQSAEHLLAQARTLLADVTVSAIKIGLLGSAGIAEAVGEILQECPGVPVVLDPVLAAGGGMDLSERRLIETVLNRLLPLTTIVTPNSPEARKLAGLDDLPACGTFLQDKGANYVLITGTHENSEQVDNLLFMPDGLREVFHWQRLPHHYHGSGCTLAAAIAALLAQGLDVFNAVLEAQDFVWQSLENAYRTGHGQHNPDRLFWIEP